MPHPNEPFDPPSSADDPHTFAERKVKEVKNGVFAMLLMLGCYDQAIGTGEGPVEDWAAIFAAAGRRAVELPLGTATSGWAES